MKVLSTTLLIQTSESCCLSVVYRASLGAPVFALLSLPLGGPNDQGDLDDLGDLDEPGGRDEPDGQDEPGGQDERAVRVLSCLEQRPGICWDGLDEVVAQNLRC